MTFRYPVTLEAEAGDEGLTVSFPDFPEAITEGSTKASALVAAIDCLDEVIAARIARDEALPFPSISNGLVVEPSVTMAAKAALHQAFMASGLKRTALARRLDVNETEIRRMLDPRHPTKIARIENALRILGKRLSVDVIDVA